MGYICTSKGSKGHTGLQNIEDDATAKGPLVMRNLKVKSEASYPPCPTRRQLEISPQGIV